MARKQSIFGSTKSVASSVASSVEESAYLINDVVSYLRAELKNTAESSDLQNQADILDETMDILTGYYNQLAELEATPKSNLTVAKTKMLKTAISRIEARL